jgi:tryptophan synthase beta chain
VEVAAKDPNTKYALGSVLNHVLLHQTVIGLEALEQMALAGDEPDVIVGCTGGGSNFAGLVMPYLGRKIKGQCHARVVAVEPAACPSMTKGPFAYDFGDTGHLTPLVKMHTLGSTFIPPGIHAGGLRYHGMAPLVSHVKDLGLIEATSVQQLDAFAAGISLRGRRELFLRRRRTTRWRGDSRGVEGQRRRQGENDSVQSERAWTL